MTLFNRTLPEDPLWREVHALFDALAQPRLVNVRRGGPTAHVNEIEGGWRLTLEAPGVAPDALQIEVLGDRLLLKGRSELDAPEGYALRRRERSEWAFERAFRLPDAADTDGITAEASNGLFTIHIPKRADVGPKRIQIQVPA